MTRHNIIRMAQEAHRELVTLDYPGHTGQLDPWTMRLLERFANLIVVAEREACAKVCEDKAMHCETKAQEAIEAGEHDEVSSIRSTAWQISVCADAIRARGQA